MASQFQKRMATIGRIAADEALGLDGAKFNIGQTVRTNLGKVGQIVAIVGNHVSIDLNGDVKKFHATTIKAI